MEITLIRHGKSQYIDNDKITCLDLQKWIENYNSHGVFAESIYPSDSIETIKNAQIVISSDLQRAKQSAKLLNPKVKAISNSIFREVELPTYSTKLLNVKFRPSVWLIISRILWIMGYANQCESLSKAKLRAKKATQLLIDGAEEHRSVVLVGHGLFNRLIAEELLRNGWKGKKKSSIRHWCCTKYTY